jgi:hypothetical protein
MTHLLMIPLVVLHVSLTAASPRETGIRAAPAPAALVAAAPSAAGRTNPETARLKATIDSMIVMLEAGQSRPFLERFVEPEFLAQKGVDAIIEEFEEEKVELLLSVLKEIRTRKPTYSKRGTIATYKIRKRSETKRTINFIKVDGLWYLRN